MSAIFITGTDTGVGKTVVTAGLTAVLRAHGHDAIPMKPVQTGGVVNGDQVLAEDVLFYQCTTDLPVITPEINPYCFIPSASPHLAAQLVGVTVDLQKIEDAYFKLASQHKFVLVEGAGGICTPITPSFLFIDLAKRLQLPVLVIVRPGLGTINHTVLTVRYAQTYGLKVKGIIINGWRKETSTMVERSNPQVIQALTGVPILGMIPWVKGLSVETGQAANLTEVIENVVRWSEIF